MIPFADLHCHSTYSDGTATPAEIVDLAVSLHLKAVSLTDHDSTLGLEELYKAAKAKGLEMISGVEFSCHVDQESVHLLGYGFDPDAPSIKKLQEKHLLRRSTRNEEIFKKLHRLGIKVDPSEITAQGIIGRPHIAELLVKHKIVGSMQEAFKKYLGEGKLAYVPAYTITVNETIDVIHAAGGVAILAHPHLIDSIPLLNKLLQSPFDGIECYYSNFTPEENARWVKRAQRRNWLETGGSDYHGLNKPYVKYGCTTVDEEHFRKLQNACR